MKRRQLAKQRRRYNAEENAMIAAGRFGAAKSSREARLKRHRNRKDAAK
jgi:hypothetical protein